MDSWLNTARAKTESEALLKALPALYKALLEALHEALPEALQKEQKHPD